MSDEEKGRGGGGLLWVIVLVGIGAATYYFIFSSGALADVKVSDYVDPATGTLRAGLPTEGGSGGQQVVVG